MRRVIVTILTLVALVSCTKSEDVNIFSDDEVRITSSIATRTVGNSWEQNDEIGVFMTTNGGETFADLGKNVHHSTKQGDGVFASSTPLYFPALSSVDLLAYYPHKITTTDAGVYLVDVATQADQGAIDLMTSSLSEVAKSPTAVEMEFDHKLSNIVLNIVNGDGYADIAAIGAISSVELSGSVTSASCDLTSGDISLGSDKETIEFVVSQSSTSITAEAIIIPQTLSGGSAILSVTTAAGGVHKVALNGEFGVGTQYSYDLKLSLTELTINGVKINDWNKTSGGDLEATVPEPIWDGNYPASVDDAKATLGSADENGTYQIGGVDKFAAFAYLVKNDNSNFGDADIVLNIDLDLGGEAWTPIGNTNNRFSGKFDGGGYEISGLFIESSSDYQGLFGYINDATITNVSVSGSVSGKGYVGGVVGRAVSNSKITNCNNSATVTGNSDQVGGIVGYTDTSSTITDCNNSGDITSLSGYGSVGGIVGSATYIVKNCYNSGTITATGSSYRNVGGVAGFAGSSSTVTSCYNSGVVVASGTDTNNVGGVVGNNCNSTVASCYNTGKVNGGTYVGGVVGYNNYNGDTTTTTNCYNIGEVSGGYTSTCSVIGYNTSIVTNCYYLDSTVTDGNATAMSDTYMQSEEFVTTLNSDSYDYNQTQPWVYNLDNYPTLDFDAVPTVN